MIQKTAIDADLWPFSVFERPFGALRRGRSSINALTTFFADKAVSDIQVIFVMSFRCAPWFVESFRFLGVFLKKTVSLGHLSAHAARILCLFCIQECLAIGL